MSLEEKIKNAKPSHWFDDIPRWKQWLIVKWARLTKEKEMKKIRIFSTKANKYIEGEDAELYVDFYLAFHRDFIFTFIITCPNLSCSGKRPIKLWKYFLIMLEKEYIKYMRRYERYFYH